MSLLEKLEENARSICPVIVYAEPEDERIVEAAGRAAARGIARPVIVGYAASKPANLPPGVRFESIDGSPRLEEFTAIYAQERGVKERVAERLVSRPLAYAGMMVKCGHAGGMVAGIAHTTAAVIQAAGLTVGYAADAGGASSCFIMVIPKLKGETNVPLIFADCAVVVSPTAEQLAGIAIASAASCRRFLGATPRVAMLSFSTAGSASHADVDKVKQATAIAATRIKDGYVQGELQLDAALNPATAQRKKVGGGEVAGQANVLIFPDLDAGNICYKAVQELAGAQAIGPILQGFAKPVCDLSRGAKVEDVVATTVLTVLQTNG
jgi:phosphate acetyltransferase